MTGRLVVDADGRIRSLRANVSRSFTVRTQRGPQTFTTYTSLRYEVVRIGNVSVPPPAWADAARERGDSD